MVEEYEEHESSQDGNPSIDEDLNTSSNATEDKQIPRGILKSATDAVLNFVKETAKKLVTTEDNTNSTRNTTNATKYPEDNSTQPLPPKTIVQLMPREDYEDSCDGDNDETPVACLSGSGCSSTEYIPRSYQAFLEIVHNICGLNWKSAKACFTNFSKILVANVTNRKENLSNTERNSNSVKNDAMNQGLEKDDSQITPEKRSSVENVRVGDSTESDVTEKPNKPKHEESMTSSRAPVSEASSASNSVHIDAQSSSDSPITSTVLPSSITSNGLSSSSIHVAAISSSVTSSIDECDFDCASAPTPLAQPPLAVNDEPSLVEPPTHEPGTDSEETISQASSETSKSIPSQSLESSRASEGLSKVNDSPTSTLGHDTVITSSIITESKIPASEKVSTQSQDGGPKGVNLDTTVHEGSPKGNKEHEQNLKGTRKGSKEFDDIPNPHVDVLKITLTDAETKEGTAEPEQANDDLASDFGIQLNETVVNSEEKEKELGKSDADIVGGAEKDVKEVETQEVISPHSCLQRRENRFGE